MPKTLEELQIKFTADAGKLDSQMKGIKHTVVGIEDPVNKAESAFSKLAKIGSAIGIAAIGAKLIDIGKESLDMANDVRESESLFEVSMGEMASDAREWSKDLASSLGLNEFAVRKNVGVLNTMFKSMGLGKKPALDMSKQMVQLSEDMASFYNLPVEEAFTKLQAGITGEAEGLKRLGILVDETTVKQYALRTGMIKQGQEMTNQQKVAARYAVILEQTSDAQGDLARTMESPTNQLRRLSNEFDQAKIALGQALQPALLAIIPVLTNVAIGAKNIIEALSQPGKDSLPGIALSIDEARERVKASLDTTTIDLAKKLDTMDKTISAAVKDFSMAEKVVKEVSITLAAQEPTTTGLERMTAIIEELNLPASIEKKINVALKDGEVNEKEAGSIEKAVVTEANKLIKNIKAEAIKQKKAIDVQLKKGEITEETSGELKAGIDEWAEKQIANITAKVTLLKAEIGQVDWKSKTFTPEESATLGNAISDAANANEIAVNAIVDKVTATWANAGAIGEAVSSLFKDAQTQFNTNNAELKALAQSWIDGASPTAETWAKAQAIREENRQLTQFMFGNNGSEGAILTAAFDENGLISESGIANMLTAFNSFVVENTTASKKILNERIGDIMNLPPDVFAAKFTGMTLADVVKQLTDEAAASLSLDNNATLAAAASNLIPSLDAAINSGVLKPYEILGFIDEINKLLGTVDYSTLTGDAKTAISNLIKIFDNPTVFEQFGANGPFPEAMEALGIIFTEGGMTAGAGLVDSTVETVTTGTADVVSATKMTGEEAMDALYQAMVDNKITRLEYDDILTAEADGSLAMMRNMYAYAGDQAMVDLIDALIAKKPAVGNAAGEIKDSAIDGMSGADSTTVGSNYGQGMANGMLGKVDAVKEAAASLSRAAINSSKYTLSEQSPSKIAKGIGEFYGEGMAIGIENMVDRVYSASSDLANQANLGAGNLSAPSISKSSGPIDIGSGGVAVAVSEGIAAGVNQVMDAMNIVIYVDGEQFGRVSLRTINDIQRRAGQFLLGTR